MNAVIIAVVVMLGLAVARVHVVLALLIGAIVGGLVGGFRAVRLRGWGDLRTHP